MENEEEIKRFLKERPAETKNQIGRAIKKSVIAVERESKKRSPVKSGLMRSRIASYNYETILEGEVIVGTRYAIYVHENLRARHKVGEAKFLENAVKFLEMNINRYFEEAIDNIIK